MGVMCYKTDSNDQSCGSAGSGWPSDDINSGLNKNSIISGTIFLPKETKSGDYEDIPRFNSGDSIKAWGYDMGEEAYNKPLKECMPGEKAVKMVE